MLHSARLQAGVAQERQPLLGARRIRAAHGRLEQHPAHVAVGGQATRLHPGVPARPPVSVRLGAQVTTPQAQKPTRGDTPAWTSAHAS